MKSAIELVYEQRAEHFYKNGISHPSEIKHMFNHLSKSFDLLVGSESETEAECPIELQQKLSDAMKDKDYIERLSIAGALITAEIDRVKYVGSDKLIVSEDMICPVTEKHCDDECCTVGSECNMSGGDGLGKSGLKDTYDDRYTI